MILCPTSCWALTVFSLALSGTRRYMVASKMRTRIKSFLGLVAGGIGIRLKQLILVLSLALNPAIRYGGHLPRNQPCCCIPLKRPLRFSRLVQPFAIAICPVNPSKIPIYQPLSHLLHKWHIVINGVYHTFVTTPPHIIIKKIIITAYYITPRGKSIKIMN